MSQVKIPESLRAYFCEPAVATATDALLDSKQDKKALVETWEELPMQFRSYLAAHQIKADFVHTLWVIWEAVWKPVLEKHGLTTKDFMSLKDLASDGESKSSISEFWDARLPLQRIHRNDDGDQFNFGVDFEGKNNGVRLLCWLISKERTENLNISGNWLEELIDAEWRVTKGFQIKRDDEHLQIDDLIKCADEAASKMLNP